MREHIRTAVVLGSGPVGGSIAAHLANVGIRVHILGRVPPKLIPEERNKGLTLQSPEVRNRFSRKAKSALLKAKPLQLYTLQAADLISAGNLEDHLECVREADWIIEAVTEKLQVKRDILRQVNKERRPGVIVSSNSYSISINEIAIGFPKEFRQHFIGTHFFYPTRYMRLMEVIPGCETLPAVVDLMSDFGQQILGKGVVIAKDTPLFIAIRIVAYDMMEAFKSAEAEGVTVEEVDYITGPVIGRPVSATFRTVDLIGLDTFMRVVENVFDKFDDEEKRHFVPPDFVMKMVERQLVGERTGQGFYRKAESDGEKMVLDFSTMAYRPFEKPRFASMFVTQLAPDLPNRLKALVSAPDQAGRFAWNLLKKTLLHTATIAAEIADDLVSIDRAMRWGYNWDLGPFEIWDAIGLPESAARMEKEGERLPLFVKELLASGRTSFYQEEGGGIYCFHPQTSSDRKPPVIPDAIFLPDLKECGNVVKSNPGASLLDIGDGIACLEFHSENKTIDEDVVVMIQDSLEEVGRNFIGLVIGNQGISFCEGLNLQPILQKAKDEQWRDLDFMVKRFQDVMLAIKYCSKPVVAAPFQRTLMQGCEIAMASSRIQAAAETNMGFVDVRVGLLPAGGGTKEVLLRALNGNASCLAPEISADIDGCPMIAEAFENIILGRISDNAYEAKRLGFLKTDDRITANPDRLIYEAKQTVIQMEQGGYRPPATPMLKVAGKSGYLKLVRIADQLKKDQYINEYDFHIADKLAWVISGGDAATGALISEQYLLDLERENYLSLLGNPETWKRIHYLLANGKLLQESWVKEKI